MIVPMRKVTVFVSLRHRDEALRKLRKLEVLHVRHVNPPVSEDQARLENDLGRAERSLRVLEREDLAGTAAGAGNQEGKVNRILALASERHQNQTVLAEKQAVLDWYREWGRISADDREALRERGIHLKLYRGDRGALKRLPEGAHVEILKSEKNLVLLALLGDSWESRLELKQEPFPREEYAAAAAAAEELERRDREIAAELAKLAESAEAIADYRENLRSRLEFARVQAGMGTEEEITWLQGWSPVDRIPGLLKAAEKEGWGLVSEEPAEDENPPTRVLPERWARVILPVFEFLGVVPGYREHDISRWFLIFFSVFVAMIVGDAGYGLLFLVIAAALHIAAAKKRKPLALGLQLLYVLSFGTILWGGITGTWFGSRALASLPFLKAVTVPQIASFPELFPGLVVDPRQKVMTVCFVIALVHLSLACILSFIKQLPRLRSVAQLGWLSLLGGLFFLVLTLVLGREMPAFAVPLAAAGLLLIVFFSRQERGVGFFKGAVRGLGGLFNTFLDSISSFSNIISYIRLFAVGMATVAIASSFNNLAAPLMKGAGIPAAILVLLIGHGLNIVMALLSVIVHGIRLNVLEFSSQLGMEWSGYEYRPFKDLQDTNKERVNP